jgi:hypothetical protein
LKSRYNIIKLIHLEVSGLNPFQSSGAFLLPLIFMTLFRLLEGPSFGLHSTSLSKPCPAFSQSPAM